MIALLTMVLFLSVAATGCVFGGDSPAADETGGAADESATTSETPAAALQLIDASSQVFCDNTERLVGEIQGAIPGEKIDLSSPQPIQLSVEQMEAVADADGAYRLTWSCGPTEAGQPWELRVSGEESERWTIVSFVGSAIDPDPDTTLQISLLEDTVPCDGTSKTLGELSNADPFEEVTFVAQPVVDLSSVQANGEGQLSITWRCRFDEASTWEVTATGTDSGRTAQFTVVGSEVEPEEIPTPVVQVDEDPFVCDGGSRVFGSLSGFLADEVVNFSSPQASALKSGQANDAGDLPIRWSCEAADAETVWELTASGAQSGRTVSFTLTGAAAPAAPDPTVAFIENPFRCDSATRPYASISGFAPREFVDFTSPQSENLRQGQADEEGALQIRWTCEASDIDRVWDVTATGATSQRSVSFQVTGAAP